MASSERVDFSSQAQGADGGRNVPFSGLRSRQVDILAGGPRAEGAESRGSELPCGSLDGTKEPSSARLRPGRAESRGSKLPCGSLDGTKEPSSARLRPGRARGSGTFEECQSLVGGIPCLQLVPIQTHRMQPYRHKNPLITCSFPMKILSENFQYIASIIIS